MNFPQPTSVSSAQMFPLRWNNGRYDCETGSDLVWLKLLGKTANWCSEFPISVLESASSTIFNRKSFVPVHPASTVSTLNSSKPNNDSISLAGESSSNLPRKRQ